MADNKKVQEEDLKKLEDEAYFELCQIIAEAMQYQAVELLNSRISAWKTKYDEISLKLDETQTKLSIVAKKIANAMLKLDGCVGVNILSNCKEGAGQTVMHYHIHLIPRYVNDGVELNPQPKQKYTNEQLDNLIKSLNL